MEKPDRGHDADADLDEIFPRQVCINLDRRPDRWERMRARFASHGLRRVRRFPAADGQSLTPPPGWTSTAGAYGCLRSHLEVVREARAQGWPAVLIFEDDVVFAPGLRADFRQYFPEVPPDWQMLHFGALHVADPVPVSEHVRRIARAYSTYAYALRESVYDAFIELNSHATEPVDLNNHTLQAERPCYCFTPYLAWVESDPSDVQGRQRDHWYLRESLVIHGAGVERLLAETTLVIAYADPSQDEGVRRNLLFLAGHYRARTPGVEVVVVEQGARPTLAPADLPEGCRLLFLGGAGPLDRARCFNAGARAARPESSLLVFSDADIFVEEWDVRGHLGACARADCTNGFGALAGLTAADTLELRRQRAVLTPWFKVHEYELAEKPDDFGGFCVFNRAAFEAAGGWEERPGAVPAATLSLRDGRHLRVFRAPNHALRLHPI